MFADVRPGEVTELGFAVVVLTVVRPVTFTVRVFHTVVFVDVRPTTGLPISSSTVVFEDARPVAVTTPVPASGRTLSGHIRHRIFFLVVPPVSDI